MHIDTRILSAAAPLRKEAPSTCAGETVVHPRSLVCDRCGGALSWTRFLSEGKRCRKYCCPRCGLTQVFVRRRIEPEPGGGL